MDEPFKPIGVNPPMKGDQVLAAQRLLAGQNQDASTGKPFGNFRPGPLDGESGPLFAAAVARAKYALGYPTAQSGPTFGAKLNSYLSGEAKLPSPNRARRQQRLAALKSTGRIRQKMVEICQWAIDHEPGIHYDQDRPIDVNHPVKKLPLTADCSGSTTIFAKWSGAPDPNGNNYNGFGFTGTMMNQLEQIHRADAMPGDLVILGNYPGEHVVVIMEPGDDPIVQSHGFEGGPLKLKLSEELRLHAGKPFAFYSLLGES